MIFFYCDIFVTYGDNNIYKCDHIYFVNFFWPWDFFKGGGQFFLKFLSQVFSVFDEIEIENKYLIGPGDFLGIFLVLMKSSKHIYLQVTCKRR